MIQTLITGFICLLISHTNPMHDNSEDRCEIYQETVSVYLKNVICNDDGTITFELGVSIIPSEISFFEENLVKNAEITVQSGNGNTYSIPNYDGIFHMDECLVEGDTQLTIFYESLVYLGGSASFCDKTEVLSFSC